MAAIATKAGLNVAPITFKPHTQGNYALVERYDRCINKEGLVERLHQEDFCQVLGRGYGDKYPIGWREADADVVTQITQVLRKHSARAEQDIQQVIRWQIFNVLAGNSDAHLKNISLLYTIDGQYNYSVTLAPFYDLVCTRAIESIEQNLAIAVGNEQNPANVTAKHWEQMASSCDVKVNFLRGQVAEMADQLPHWSVAAIDAFEAEHGDYPALERVKHIIDKQCKRISRSL